jgi:CRP-like cAMP-binding protein
MDYLQHVSVFQKFSDARMEQLIAKMTERRYENGATIMTAGTEAKTFFMIRSGEVKMHMVDTDRILTRVQGEYFGEIGLLAEDHKCAFTATAETVRT